MKSFEQEMFKLLDSEMISILIKHPVNYSKYFFWEIFSERKKVLIFR